MIGATMPGMARPKTLADLLAMIPPVRPGYPTPGFGDGRTGSGVGLPSFSGQPAAMPDVGTLPRGRDDLPSMGLNIPSAMGDATPAMAQLSHLNNQQPPSGGIGSLIPPNGTGMDAPSVAGQGSLMPGQFELGRDLTKLSQVARIRPNKGPNWKKILPILSAGLNGYLAAMGNPAGLANINAMNDMRQRDADGKTRLQELNAKRYEPQQIGRSLVQLGEDGQYRSLYDAPADPQPFEAYARARGFEPGTPEYRDAVEEYRLGAWSDPAMEAKQTLEGVRYGYRDDLQDDRLTTSRRNTDVRAGVTRRGQDMTDRRVRNGQTMTDARVRGSAGYSGRGGKGGADLIGPVYTKDGKRIQFSKSRNSYVSVP